MVKKLSEPAANIDTAIQEEYNNQPKENVVWDDLRFPATPAITGFFNANYEPAYDNTNNGLLFPDNDETQIARSIGQFPHTRKNGSNIKPHLHYIQSQAATPTFEYRYRWYKNGDTVPSFSAWIPCVNHVFPYTSGDLLQICTFPELDGSSIDAVSSVFDWQLRRDSGDAVTGDVLLKEFDIHYQVDQQGSRQEFIK